MLQQYNGASSSADSVSRRSRYSFGPHNGRRRLDSTSAAVSRAKTCFLVSSIVGNSLTFAIGPKLLDNEETPNSHQDKASNDQHAQNSVNGNRQNDEEQATEKQEHNNPQTPLAEQPRIRRYTITRQLHYCQILSPVMHPDIENRSPKEKGSG